MTKKEMVRERSKKITLVRNIVHTVLATIAFILFAIELRGAFIKTDLHPMFWTLVPLALIYVCECIYAYKMRKINKHVDFVLLLREVIEEQISQSNK